MVYRNTDTGAELETVCCISGDRWVEIRPPGGSVPQKQSSEPKKGRVKKDERVRDGR